jgi:hypothetical protein
MRVHKGLSKISFLTALTFIHGKQTLFFIHLVPLFLFSGSILPSLLFSINLCLIFSLTFWTSSFYYRATGEVMIIKLCAIRKPFFRIFCSRRNTSTINDRSSLLFKWHYCFLNMLLMASCDLFNDIFFGIHLPLDGKLSP